MVDRRPFPTLVAALAVAVLVSAPLVSRAEDPPAAAKRADDPSAAEARRHYEEGTKAFNLGEYPRAITEFKAAYNAKPDPSLLYNIGQSFRLQGDAGQAVFFYKSFLRNMPATPNRKEVEGRIRVLEKQADEQRKEATVAPVVTAPPVVPVTPPPPVVTPPPPLETAPPVVVKPIENTPPSATPSTTPAPLEAQSAPAAAIDLSPPPSDEPPPSRPIYKKWWFWTGIGAVLLIGVVAVAARDKPPSTSFGLFDPTFMKP